MTNEELEQIIKQIKKYNLTNAFAYEDEFKKWMRMHPFFIFRLGILILRST